MSTEARRASIPPRPSTPPGPPVTESGRQPSEGAEDTGPRPDTDREAAEPAGGDWFGPRPAGTPPRPRASDASTGAGPADTFSSGAPRFPDLRPTGGERQTSETHPPPPASARFPDTPPGGTRVPPRPATRPSAPLGAAEWAGVTPRPGTGPEADAGRAVQDVSPPRPATRPRAPMGGAEWTNVPPRPATGPASGPDAGRAHRSDSPQRPADGSRAPGADRRDAPPRPATEPRPVPNGADGQAPPHPATEPRTTSGTGLPPRPFAPPRPDTPAPRTHTGEQRVTPPPGSGATRRHTAPPPFAPAESRAGHRPVSPPPASRPGTPHPFARRTAVPGEAPPENTARLRPAPAGPPPAPSTPPSGGPVSTRPVPGPGESFTGEPFTGGESFAGGESFTGVPFPGPARHVPRSPHEVPHRPFVSLAPPDTYDDDTAHTRPAGPRRRGAVAAATACVVLGLGLIGGAVTGSWLTGDSSDGSGQRDAFTAAGDLWHSVPVDELFPPTVKGEGAGPGGADRTWTRVAVAPDSGCEGAFDPLLQKALAPAGCLRLLRATYTDATRSHVTTVGLLFTKADAAAMGALRRRFETQGLDSRRDLMPRPYAAKGTVSAGFGDGQRASWTLSVLTDAPVVAYAVSGFADGRTVTEPQPAEDAMKADATTPTAQAGLGHDAQGLADRVERSLRGTVDSATEKPS
ncbi:hypothetical protein [Streptomyces sp. NPDC006285]|uniref:hypothetical protein n=1 Tax=Streptomyces sp. NPDC006285 TaxID=3364742 RepID=UPI0036990F77